MESISKKVIKTYKEKSHTTINNYIINIIKNAKGNACYPTNIYPLLESDMMVPTCT